MDVPVIDLRADDTAQRIDTACREIGFFVVVGHGIDPALFERLDAAAREFFALPDDAKQRVAMVHGGRAWRGWFPLGGEMTGGVPDGKEGLYFGEELGEDEPAVAAGVPLHGRNLFPAEVPQLRDAVLAWFAAMTALGHRLMAEIALGLGLSPSWFSDHLTADPTLLFRIFRYPDTIDHAWGVAEHTDYGLLTMLAQDDCGGLQVRDRTGVWQDVAPVPRSFVCNIGDMLERMTGGRYRSTPHRVRNTSGRDRLSYPFFFDPSWTARIDPLPLGGAQVDDDPSSRWDRRSVFEFDGTYGEYLTAKVARVFPHLVGTL